MAETGEGRSALVTTPSSSQQQHQAKGAVTAETWSAIYCKQ